MNRRILSSFYQRVMSILNGNLKTINGNSIVGSGNVTISGSANWGSIGGTLSSQTDLQTALNNKQDTLVSGTNIVSINSNTLLNIGDLTIDKTFVGLGNVDDTSDINKPVSTLQASAIALKQDTLVSGTNIKTINSSSILGSGNLTISASPSGLTGQIQFNNAGSFGSDSNLFWDNTNKRLGIGATPSTSVRLDVRSQGALSTDIAFRIRNSANTNNLIEITGDGGIRMGLGATINSTTSADACIVIGKTAQSGASISTNSASSVTIGESAIGGYYGVAIGRQASTQVQNGVSIGAGSSVTGNQGVCIGGSSTSSINGVAVGMYSQAVTNATAIGGDADATGQNSIAIGMNAKSTAQSSITLGYAFTNSIASSFALALNSGLQTDQSLFINRNSNMVFRFGALPTASTHFSTTATNTITIHNGTATSTNIIDAFQMYSADIVAGNASPHFRTENGSIIKLYKETTSVASASFVQNTGNAVNDASRFGGYTIAQIVQALQNQGLLT